MIVVVDTNVPIAANGKNTHASLACQYVCIEFLEKTVALRSRTKIALDTHHLIFTEYKSYLSFGGKPGVGDMFFKYLHDHMYEQKKVQHVPITPIQDETRGFNELPVNLLDKNDRKFLSVAIVSGGKVVNATDTDWHIEKQLTDGLGVKVAQLCPEHGCNIGD